MRNVNPTEEAVALVREAKGILIRLNEELASRNDESASRCIQVIGSSTAMTDELLELLASAKVSHNGPVGERVPGRSNSAG